MFITLCSTYLCRKGDIDEAIYLGSLVIALIELGIEYAFIASILEK